MGKLDSAGETLVTLGVVVLETNLELDCLNEVTPVISVCVRILMLLVLDSHSRDQGAVAGRRPQ